MEGVRDRERERLCSMRVVITKQDCRKSEVEDENLDLIMLIEVENLIESNPINRKRQGLWFLLITILRSGSSDPSREVHKFAFESVGER